MTYDELEEAIESGDIVCNLRCESMASFHNEGWSIKMRGSHAVHSWIDCDLPTIIVNDSDWDQIILYPKVRISGGSTITLKVAPQTLHGLDGYLGLFLDSWLAGRPVVLPMGICKDFSSSSGMTQGVIGTLSPPISPSRAFIKPVDFVSVPSIGWGTPTTRAIRLKELVRGVR